MTCIGIEGEQKLSYQYPELGSTCVCVPCVCVLTVRPGEGVCDGAVQFKPGHTPPPPPSGVQGAPKRLPSPDQGEAIFLRKIRYIQTSPLFADAFRSAASLVVNQPISAQLI